MESRQRVGDYRRRSKELLTLFWLNLDIAKTELVVKDSPVDYEAHHLICDIYECIIATHLFIPLFALMVEQNDNTLDDPKKEDESFKRFNKLEETFDTQTQFLEKLRVKPKPRA